VNRSRARSSLFLTLCGCVACTPAGPGSSHPSPARSTPAPVPSAIPSPADPVELTVLGINDFHGHLAQTEVIDGRPVGGAAVLAAYLRDQIEQAPATTLIAVAGDHAGASPASSALLRDEPAIMMLNELADSHCSYTERLDPRCNIVATLGNHEFDDGESEIVRLINGGGYPRGPYLENPYRGARFPVVCANVLERDSKRPLFPPYVIKLVVGVPVAFIGAVLAETPRIVTPSKIRGLEFRDEADAINKQAEQLSMQGVAAIGVLLHQGGSQEPYAGPTRDDVTVDGPIVNIVKRLDDSIDFVVSGHRHQFTNARLPNSKGRPILVTQAYSAGKAFARISLTLDPLTQDVSESTAEIVTTFADVAPGNHPDGAVSVVVTAAEQQVAPQTEQVVGRAARRLTRHASEAGECPLGNLIADAHRAALKSDVAFTNLGGIRADIDEGEVTWGELFSAQPFDNDLVVLELTGQDLIVLLNEQWTSGADSDVLQTSGLEYTWDPRPGAQNNRVVEARIGGKPLRVEAKYTVVVNRYLAEGGEGLQAFASARKIATAPSDLEALAQYIKSQPQPFDAGIEGRIRVVPRKRTQR
jgi:5'-nucleotidase